uniref:CUB domain-containing protein n=1 Tax=Acrobeloides nanus TaxID=290746 RepID=A0A914C632_9BILA
MEQDITLRRLKLFLLVFLGLSLTPGVVNARCYCMNKIVQLLRQDDYRVILSPEFPRPYCPSLNCIWHIVAPDNTSKIHFFSKNIDLRPDRDFIHFYVSEKETVEADLFNPLHR